MKPLDDKPPGFNMTRQQFDACLKRVATRLPPLEAHHRTELWRSFNGIPLEPTLPVPRFDHWTREALALLEPLRVEIETCKAADRRGTIERRYQGISVTVPGGGRGRAPIEVDVLDLFDIYRAELERIQTEMEDALREGNHRRYAKVQDQPMPESIAIIVENERTAHTAAHPRYAGTLHWTQWARPGLVKRITLIFEQARAMTPTRGRCWIPFPTPATLKEQP